MQLTKNVKIKQNEEIEGKNTPKLLTNPSLQNVQYPTPTPLRHRQHKEIAKYF
jgi:hypothetical protein